MQQKFKPPANSALLMVDHQTGLSNGVADQSIPEFKNNVVALAKVGRMFKLPTIITTGAADGPNGPLLPEITEILPDAPVIHRPGEICAWDNADFRNAVGKTGRKKLIIAGVSTDVCVAFCALAETSDGHDVYAVIDASGSWNSLVTQTATLRMIQAGIIPMNWVAVCAELQSDWRNETGHELAKLMGEHLPFYGHLIGNHTAASS